MSPRSFWTILIKVLGIYTLLQGLIEIPAFLRLSGIFYAVAFPPNASQGNFFALTYLLLLVGIFGLIIWECLFKTDWVIDRLKLNTGIVEDRLGFNMHRSDILKIVIIIIGGVTLIDAAPAALQEFILCIQKIGEYDGFKKDPTTAYLLFHISKIAIGIFMLTGSRVIVNFIERKKREPVEVTIN